MSEQVASKETTFTISSLSALLTKTLQESFPTTVLVDAEISNFKTYPSGHWYFSLSDERATLNAVMFKGANRLVRLTAGDGVKVRVSCEVNFYSPSGKLQLIVKRMTEQGIGNQKAQFEELKQKLIAEGLTSLDRKRKIPTFPNVIAVVTSPNGAVIQDILTILNQRWPIAEVLLYSSAVQGDSAPRELLHGLKRAIFDARADVIIIGRGGGTSEDLNAFNNELLCRAIATSGIPVVSAVGHETDTGLTDLVADVRAATPSQAAELVTPDVLSLMNQLNSLEQRLLSRTDTQISLGEQRLELCHFKLTEAIDKKTERMKECLNLLKLRLVPPIQYISIKRTDVNYIKLQLDRYISTFMQTKATQLEGLSKQLDVLNPLATLNRGYGIILNRRKDSDRTIGSVGDIVKGGEIEIRLKDGRIDATVERIQKDQL